MTPLDEARAARCPVCQAAFRGTEICARCGADRSVLMLLSAHAYRLRAQAKRCLLAGDASAGLAAAEAAQQLHATARGAVLLLICQAAVEAGPSTALPTLSTADGAHPGTAKGA